MKKLFSLFVVFFVLTLGAKAQTPPAQAVGTYSFTAGYAIASGAVDNGTVFEFTKQFSNRGYGQVKNFLLSKPSGINITSVGPRYEIPLNAIWKTNAFFDTTKYLPFIDGNIGVAKDTTGSAKLAYGAGVGLNVKMSQDIKILAFEVDYYQSKILPNNHVWISNVKAYESGITVSFGR